LRVDGCRDRDADAEHVARRSRPALDQLTDQRGGVVEEQPGVLEAADRQTRLRQHAAREVEEARVQPGAGDLQPDRARSRSGEEDAHRRAADAAVLRLHPLLDQAAVLEHPQRRGHGRARGPGALRQLGAREPWALREHAQHAQQRRAVDGGRADRGVVHA
jgi:hypothetical protein